VIVATDGELVRRALEPVYAALALDWDPATAGSVADEVPGVGVAEVEDALIAELGRRFELLDAELDAETLALAATLEADHEPLA
jgi:octanoyl-[GcvH]:protein N-octanoyltransferase